MVNDTIARPLRMRTSIARRAVLPAVLLVLAFAVSCVKRSPVAPSPPVVPTFATTPIMGPSRLSAAQLVAWFKGRQPQPAGVYRATEPVEVLARLFIEEGAAENVAGDVALVQSVLETGWFRFAGVVEPWMHNFAGIGAPDANPQPAVFPDARTGVRAQIQHLRAYADSTALACAAPPLHHPCVDPRFNLVNPRGRAPNWNDLGGGNWAADRQYGAKILALYAEALRFNGEQE